MNINNDTIASMVDLNDFHEIISACKKGVNKTTYIMVGDSTRSTHGKHIYKHISKKLKQFKVKTYLVAKSNLKAEHWGLTTLNLQRRFPTVNDVIKLLPGDGSNCIVDICLGINDTGDHTYNQVAGYIQSGIDQIKLRKPNALIMLTSPNRLFYEPGVKKLIEAYDALTASHRYGYIDVLQNVFKEWNDNIQAEYFVDNTHPNKKGQMKIAEYIETKLIPN